MELRHKLLIPESRELTADEKKDAFVFPWRDKQRQQKYGFDGDWKGLMVEYNRRIGINSKKLLRDHIRMFPRGPYFPQKEIPLFVHWASLRPSAWMDKIFIDAYATILCNEFNMQQKQQYQDANKVLYIEFNSIAVKNGFPSKLHPDKIRDINSFPFILSIIRTGEYDATTGKTHDNHFVLMIINRTNRKIFIADSFACDYRRQPEDGVHCGTCDGHLHKMEMVRTALDDMLKANHLQDTFADLSSTTSSATSTTTPFPSEAYENGGVFSGMHESQWSGDIVDNFRMYCVTDISFQNDGISCGGFALIYLRETLKLLQAQTVKHGAATSTTNPIIKNCKIIADALGENVASTKHVKQLQHRVRAEFRQRLVEVFDRVMDTPGGAMQVQSDRSIMDMLDNEKGENMNLCTSDEDNDNAANTAANAAKS